MANFSVDVSWQRNGAAFTDNYYSRVHRWTFDGGAEIAASASPHIVPTPLSDPALVDPEEAFVASIASCHMLFFLSFAARRGWIVDSYTDHAEGYMEPNADGKMWVARVRLRPSIKWTGDTQPSGQDVGSLHHDAHEACFIANSVNTEILIEGH